MMSTMNQSPRSAAVSASILSLAFVFLVVAPSIVAQSRIVRPTPQPSPKRPHVATLRASDSSEGSRVAISSDQSLNNYEAYRRGDRFYVKIPAADVPRAEAVRGRGFADVKAQRAGDSTVLSFRLQPGASAHVEQRANKLDVVVSVPGGTPSVAANRPSREVARPSTSETNRGNTSKRPSDSTNSNRSASQPKPGKEPGLSAANKGAGNQKASQLSNSNSNSKVSSGSNSNANLNANSKPTPSPTPTISPSPKTSPSVKSTSPTPPGKSDVASSASPSASNQTAANQTGTDAWSQMKARANYWLLLAQLNPVPVVAGALILLAIIALLLFQRRRAKATKRVKVTKTKTETAKPSVEAPSESSVAAAESGLPEVPLAEAAVASTAVAAAEKPAAVEPVVAVPPATSEDNGRREQVNQVSAEARKVFDGDQYDESVIGSSDPETRRLIGAELLSAMVGRNVGRRERAREAFMKHGYFDDATRDLRVAESENERAAAARRLSFVQDREATPHLVGALQDSSPDVRRAAVEALMDVRDPAAIGPLNSLLQNETDRKVPRNLIQQAIDSCATSTAVAPSPDAAGVPPSFTPESSSPPPPSETEREVIEL
jgi:hypothetical protein